MNDMVEKTVQTFSLQRFLCEQAQLYGNKMTLRQGQVLMALRLQDHSNAELVRFLKVSPSVITRATRALGTAGHIKPFQPEGRVRHRYRLTTNGRQLAERLQATWNKNARA